MRLAAGGDVGTTSSCPPAADTDFRIPAHVEGSRELAASTAKAILLSRGRCV